MEDAVGSSIVTYNQLAKELDELYQLYAKKSGLSQAAFWILYCVHERREPYTQKELCDIWSYSRQTINSALKNLETQGMVYLDSQPDNRKNKLILLTDTGKRLVERIIVPLAEAEKNVFIQMGADDTQAFLTLTRRHLELFRREISQLHMSPSEDV